LGSAERSEIKCYDNDISKACAVISCKITAKCYVLQLNTSRLGTDVV